MLLRNEPSAIPGELTFTSASPRVSLFTQTLLRCIQGTGGLLCHGEGATATTALQLRLAFTNINQLNCWQDPNAAHQFLADPEIGPVLMQLHGALVARKGAAERC